MKLQQTKDYLLLIDEEADKKQTMKWYWNTKHEKLCFQQLFMPEYHYLYYALIIAYFPLTIEASELGLPLLPSFDVNAENLAKIYSEKKSSSPIFREAHERDFIAGYKAAQPKQFTIENLRKAFKAGQDYIAGGNCMPNENGSVDEETYIQSLSTQQLPKEFIPEYTKDFVKGPGFGGAGAIDILKTTTNSEGKEVLVGTYQH